MKDNFKNKMLLLLILNNYTSKRAIKSLLKGRSNASSTIKKLKEDGWIKERKVGYKAKNRKEKKITYYMITAHGFNCFLEEVELASSSESLQTFEYAKWMKGMMPIFQSLDCSMNLTSEKIIKHLDLSTSTLIAFAIGASFSPLVASIAAKAEEQKKREGIENKISLTQIVSEAIRRYVDAEDGDLPYLFPASEIRFTNARAVKHVTVGKYKSSANIMYGRFTGIFEAPQKAVMAYAPPIRGMSWNRWVVNGEILAYQIFLSHQGLYSIDPFSNINGVIFVEDEKMFDNLMKNYHEKRNDNDVLGSGLSEFLVFPLTKNGLDQFHHYLLNDREVIEKKIVQQIVRLDDFNENQVGDAILFPILEQSGLPVTIGIYIDIVRINRLISYPSELQYAIVCKAWQEEFYRKVLNPTEFIIID